jgi:cobalt-zinc-cadmium efflux system protein
MHTHHHSHQHGNHSHSQDASLALGWVFWLNLGFAIIEIAGGLLFNSMAILADALHDLGDCLALGLAWYFHKLSNKKRDSHFSYGYRRFSLLAAVINGIILVGGSLLILRETIPRLWQPALPLQTPGIIVLALLGLSVNGFAVWRLRGGHSANEKVVMLHLWEDVLGWVAVLVGGVVMYFSHWYILDSLLAVAIACWVSWNALQGLYQNLGILLQMIPQNIDLAGLQHEIQSLPGVVSVHDLHSWSLDGEYHVLTLHVVVKDLSLITENRALKQAVKTLAHKRGVNHLTLELEGSEEICELENC